MLELGFFSQLPRKLISSFKLFQLHPSIFPQNWLNSHLIPSPPRFPPIQSLFFPRSFYTSLLVSITVQWKVKIRRMMDSVSECLRERGVCRRRGRRVEWFLRKNCAKFKLFLDHNITCYCYFLPWRRASENVVCYP